MILLSSFFLYYCSRWNSVFVSAPSLQKATINGLKGAPICLTWKRIHAPSDEWFFYSCLITLGLPLKGPVTATWCVPNVLFTERDERSKERESILMSVIHRKRRERITSAWLVDTSRVAGKDTDGVHWKQSKDEKGRTGCALVRLGWSSWHEELGFDKRIKSIAVRLNRQRKRDPTDRPACWKWFGPLDSAWLLCLC